ncbi:hypothetical protein [Spirosoma rhododendri]|uniref:DUF2846 domain-containing protein n=1 Tax=Spirosoma rhododendri TaxID=2728024 RepID=A0A7L5DU37_9BACT|nr:hypothetical protein [Spirosoma rhododendri]QJD80108.1 hypothetical protein HH216_18090 [Spirosoma rhododendri]
MKQYAFFGLLTLSVTFAFGQSVLTTKIYLVKSGSVYSPAVRSYTTLDAGRPIVVRDNAYTVIETDADSLGILPDGQYNVSPSADDYQSGRPVAPKPTFLTFEKGKTYYFKVGRIYQNSFFDISDLSEQAFKLFVGINQIDKTPRRYFLSKSGEGVSKRP